MSVDNFVAYFANCETLDVTSAPKMCSKKFVFFPVFFLYRHSIELFLKSIACTQITHKIDIAIFFKDTFHDPESILKYITAKTSLSLPNDELQWLLAYFHNIASFDKASDSFRYPYHIKKKKIFWESKHIFILEYLKNKLI